MTTYKQLLGACAIIATAATTAFAGNPDRQGEAGAYELTINPWARSNVFYNCSRVMGVEATYLNPAGLGASGSGTEILLSRTNYLQSTGIGINAVGAAIQLKEGSNVGISLGSMDFGDIAVTTTDQPEGSGATYRPAFFNIGLSYAYTFEKHISVGATVRAISEGTANVTASSIAFDAGVMYTTGEKNNVHFGVALKNIGGAMQYSGDGLTFVGLDPLQKFPVTLNKRARQFELPSSLNIGVAYDINVDAQNKLSVGANFISNSFARDQI